MKKEEMLKFIDDAIKEQAPYFAVLVDLGLPEPEQIINPLANLEEKKKYYDEAYDDELHLKANKKIRIVGFTYINA